MPLEPRTLASAPAARRSFAHAAGRAPRTGGARSSRRRASHLCRRPPPAALRRPLLGRGERPQRGGRTGQLCGRRRSSLRTSMTPTHPRWSAATSPMRTASKRSMSFGSAAAFSVFLAAWRSFVRGARIRTTAVRLWLMALSRGVRGGAFQASRWTSAPASTSRRTQAAWPRNAA